MAATGKMYRKAVILFRVLGVFLLLQTGALASENGTWGDLSWTLDNEGTLTISGTGEMDAFYYDEGSWRPYKNSIKKVVINSGVTSIAKEAFSNCSNLNSVILADSITKMGEYAFRGTALTSVTTPKSWESTTEEPEERPVTTPIIRLMMVAVEPPTAPRA